MDDSGLNDQKFHKLYLLSILSLMIMPVIDSYSTEQYTDLWPLVILGINCIQSAGIKYPGHAAWFVCTKSIKA